MKIERKAVKREKTVYLSDLKPGDKFRILSAEYVKLEHRYSDSFSYALRNNYIVERFYEFALVTVDVHHVVETVPIGTVPPGTVIEFPQTGKFGIVREKLIDSSDCTPVTPFDGRGLFTYIDNDTQVVPHPDAKLVV